MRNLLRYGGALVALLASSWLAACQPAQTGSAPSVAPAPNQPAAVQASDPRSPLPQPAKVRMGAIKVINLAPMWVLPEIAKKYSK
jgi:hypothetical protein